MEVLVLASGSSGNATLVTSGETSVLVDAGISALAVRTRLAAPYAACKIASSSLPLIPASRAAR